MAGGPIFIVGPMGSGTTLMRLVLDSHPHIAIPQETGFMRGYDALRFTPFKWSGRNWTQRLGWSPEELDDVARDLYERLFTRYAHEHGKERWGEKTPLHTWHVDDMARVFPDARFVALIRHPAASVGSNIRRFSARMSKATWHWHQYARELARKVMAHPGRSVLIRYEDLVLQPEPVLRELLGWLGEPWDDAVLEHHTVQVSRGGRTKVEGHSRTDEPIDVSRIDKWTRTMEAEHHEWVSGRLGRLAAFYGYDVEDPAVLEPLARDASARLVTGADLEARLGAFADLDLTAPEEPTPYELPYDPRRFVIVEREEFNRLVQPRGARRVAVRLARRLPKGPRTALIRAVRAGREALGLRRPPAPK